MNLPDLVRDVLSGNLLAARQWVADARREPVRWEHVPQPHGLTAAGMSIAAALVELLASRAGEPPPAWTASVGPSSELMILDPGLEQMPRSFAHAQRHAPEPLRRRNLIALPDFLDVA